MIGAFFALALALPSSANAVTTRGDLDGDGKPEEIRLDRATLTVFSDGRLRGQVHLREPRGAERGAAQPQVEVRIVRLPSAPVAPALAEALVHARVAYGGGVASEAVVALRPTWQVLYLGRTGPSDDGEKSEELRVDASGLWRYQRTPFAVRCDGENRLFLKRYDFVAGRFVPFVPPWPEDKREPLVAHRALSEAASEARPLGLFHFTAESSDGSGLERADSLGAPHELDQPEDEAGWLAGVGAAAVGTWVVARGPRSHPPAALWIGGRAAERPRRLGLLLDESSFTVELPREEGPLEVVLPPNHAGCLALVVLEPAAQGATRLRGVAITTDLDTPQRSDRSSADPFAPLVARVASLGPEASLAERLLGEAARAEPRAVERALLLALAAKERLAPTAERRLLRLLAPIGGPAAAPRLAEALSSVEENAEESAKESDRALIEAALRRMGDAGRRALLALALNRAQPDEGRIRALALLGQMGQMEPEGRGSSALTDLIAEMGLGSSTLRHALIVTLQHQPLLAPALEEALRDSVLATPRDPRRIGDLARALAQAAHGSTVVAAAATLQLAWQTTSDAPSDFTLRVRLLRAIGELGQASLAPLVEAALATCREPELRAEAVRALARLGATSLSALRTAADDPDPGVRRLALVALGQEHDRESAALLVAKLADRWPLVRRAATEALGSRCLDSALAAEALWRVVGGRDPRRGDPSEDVRRAALRALGPCGRKDWIREVLADEHQALPLREAALGLVGRDAVAAPLVAKLLLQLLEEPAADEQTLAVSLTCLAALGQLGRMEHPPSPVRAAVVEAATEPFAPLLRARALETLGALCPRGARATIEEGRRDPDEAVRRAADSALRQCNR